MVSIHAPARGATWWGIFNRSLYKFQSTRPRGARPGLSTGGRIYASFNPRARAGRDLYRCYRTSTHQRFNPRARAGRDTGCKPYRKRLLCFNPRAPRGARLDIAKETPKKLKFQSTRPRGARPKVVSFEPNPFAFQSTRPRGARLESITQYNYFIGFNPRARAGRDKR